MHIRGKCLEISMFSCSGQESQSLGALAHDVWASRSGFGFSGFDFEGVSAGRRECPETGIPLWFHYVYLAAGNGKVGAGGEQIPDRHPRQPQGFRGSDVVEYENPSTEFSEYTQCRVRAESEYFLYESWARISSSSFS